MCIKNRAVSLVYKILLLGLCGFGLYSYSGLPGGAFSASAFKYYTILSNLLVFLFTLAGMVYLVRRIAKNGVRGYATYAPGLKGAVVMAITVTMLIYWFILAPGSFSMAGGGDGTLRNSIVHLYVPLAVLADWLLFDRKGRWGVLAPVLWEIIPLLYWGYTILAAWLGVTYANGARYPYGFIDTDVYGWPTVLRNVGLLCMAFLALGYILWGLDRLLASFDKSREDSKTLYKPRMGLFVPSGVTRESVSFSPALGDVEPKPDPEKEQLVERALEAEPALNEEFTRQIAGENEPGVAALAQPPEQGDAVARLGASTVRDGTAITAGPGPEHEGPH